MGFLYLESMSDNLAFFCVQLYNSFPTFASRSFPKKSAYLSSETQIEVDFWAKNDMLI